MFRVSPSSFSSFSSFSRSSFSRSSFPPSLHRVNSITRPYNIEQILPLRSKLATPYPSAILADKLYNTFRTQFDKRQVCRTFGILDPVQLIQSAPYLSVAYVSGWQSASTCPSNDEFGPDFADYPADTIPLLVRRLFKAQEFHDRKQQIALTTSRNPGQSPIDYFVPLIADADTGFGGTTSVMKLTKMMIESGASGIHLEDQRSGSKRCGHLGSKVLVSTQEHIDRLVAARLQADLLDHPLIIIARTDAEKASYLDNDIDVRDHPFILGKLRTENGVKEELLTHSNALRFLSSKEGKNRWESCRSRDGFYQIKSGVDYCIARGLAYAPYADLLWMETSTPDLVVAKRFATAIHEKYPSMMLAYNLSPSFNWDSMKMTDSQLREFSNELGKLGYVYNFVTLAGFHANGLAITEFSRKFAEEGMLAYVRDIQREERKTNNLLLEHQKWSGTQLTDHYQQLVTRDLSTSTTGEGNTEVQFTSSPPTSPSPPPPSLPPLLLSPPPSSSTRSSEDSFHYMVMFICAINILIFFRKENTKQWRLARGSNK